MRRWLLIALLLACKPAEKPALTLITTTSTQDSGLLERLVPAAEKAAGRRVRVIAVGSGEALSLAARGEGDVLIAHSPAAEIANVEQGHLVDRRPLMWNRFLIVGPVEDPAKVRDARGDATEAFRRIRAAGTTFVSRGDESGTHQKELEIWRAAGLEPKPVKSTGQGQSETLLIADELGAYALVDSSTFTKLRMRRLVPLLDPQEKSAGTVSLVNPYHVMRTPKAAESALALQDWLMSAPAAAVIGSGGLFSPGSPAGGG